MPETESYYQSVRRRGVTRRDFLKFCAMMGGMLGLAGLFMILTGLAMCGGSNPNEIIQSLFGWVVLDLGGEYQVRNLHHLVAWGYAVFLLSHLYMVLRQDLLDDDGTVWES